MAQDPDRERGLTLAVGAAVAVLFVPLMVPLLTGRVFAFGDLSAMHLPVRHVYQQALVAGESFLWTSAFGGGAYLHAEGQAGMAHPLHLVLYRFLPLGAAFNVELLISYAMALTGMSLLLRRIGLSRVPALVGGLMFAFCGYNLLHFLHLNMVATVAQIPWLLWASDLVLTGETARRRAIGVAGIAATLASQIMLGFPPAIWLALLAVSWFTGYHVATGVSWRRATPLVAAAAVGVLVGAIQWLPTLDLSRESFRADSTTGFRLSYSLHPWNLAQLVSPYTFASRIYSPDSAEQTVHELAIYNGAFGWLCVVWIVMRWRPLPHRRLAGAFLCLAALGLVLALGRYGGVYPLLGHLPGLSGFRAPARHILLTHLALAGLAAIALEDLTRLARDRLAIEWSALWPLALPVVISVGMVIAGVVLIDSGCCADLHLRGGAAAAGAVPFAAIAVTMALAARGTRVALPLLVMVSALDLGWWGLSYVWAQPPVRVESLAAPEGLPPGARPGDLVHPFNSNNHVNLFVLRGLRTTRAYLGLYGEPVLSWYDPQTWTLMGVKWVWGADRWLAWEGTMPRARLASAWRVSTDPPADLRGIDLSRTVLVDAAPGETAGEPGHVVLKTDAPGRMAVETHTPAPQLLVLTERFHAGWRASIDGHSVPVRRAYGDLLACAVPPGSHAVSWEFAPLSATWGLRLTLIGLAATALLTMFVARGACTEGR